MMLTDITKVCQDLDNNTSLFLDILDTIPADKLMQKSTYNNWSVLECAEHMLIREEAISVAINEAAEPVEGRQPDSKIKLIRDTFLEFAQRLQLDHPESPKSAYTSIAQFSEAFRECRRKIKAALDEHPDWECKTHEHPRFGFMTKIEWAYYLIYHTERHLQQINRIEAGLK